jgi:hypothetical protein
MVDFVCAMPHLTRILSTDYERQRTQRNPAGIGTRGDFRLIFAEVCDGRRHGDGVRSPSRRAGFDLYRQSAREPRPGMFRSWEIWRATAEEVVARPDTDQARAEVA